MLSQHKRDALLRLKTVRGHLAENPDPDRERVLALLASNGAAGADMLRGLSDEQLARRMTFRGWTMSAEELAVQVQVGHVRWHIASIRAALA
jgi:hypothetical protein